MPVPMSTWRPMETVPNWHGHPSLGWHRVAATGRWHLYETYMALGMMPPAERTRRNCDDAEAEHARRPQLWHRDLVRLRRGDVLCAECAAKWDALAALPIHPDYIGRQERIAAAMSGRPFL